eukprot:GHVT01056373.1.p2 GENE.GHVT01056373.1~~GHVT01056373.1.p2  ORF type:complete len:127 (-),score=28.28 GHVT01056373.1:23-403(-)
MKSFKKFFRLPFTRCPRPPSFQFAIRLRAIQPLVLPGVRRARGCSSVASGGGSSRRRPLRLAGSHRELSSKSSISSAISSTPPAARSRVAATAPTSSPAAEASANSNCASTPLCRPVKRSRQERQN